LHFGLLGWGANAKRQFGGIGLMVDRPGVELAVQPADRFSFEGLLSARVESLVARIGELQTKAGKPFRPARIEISQAPPEHAGFGVGTQLGLALAKALLELNGEPESDVIKLARLTGRGNRSGIGLHGFQHGGLIVDGGRKRETEIPPLLTRVPFPEDWSILIIQPPGPSGLHGPDEVRAFATLPPIDRNITDGLCRLVLLEILPAVIEHDLPAFGAGLSELQSRVGACFAHAQGGIYTSPAAASIVEELTSLGFVGAGQSSWGPTLYAFTELTREDIAAASDRLLERFDLDASSIFWTNAANEGASVSREG
jgi:beta-RFAP synthase